MRSNNLESLVGKKVDIYWNLHRSCWSVRHGRRVVAHLNGDSPTIFGPGIIGLEDVRWVVQPAGNAKVRRENKKNVHAFCRGTVCQPERLFDTLRRYAMFGVTYNPYVHTSFVLTHDERPISRSEIAWLTVNDLGKPIVKAAHVWR
jgi:hypothetical protein